MAGSRTTYGQTDVACDELGAFDWTCVVVASTACRIWDLRLEATDTRLRSFYGTFVNGGNGVVNTTM
jgi:hypothetical protein